MIAPRRPSRSGRASGLSPAGRYGAAAVVAALAISVRLALDPLWGVRFTFMMLVPGVALSAWIGGFGPGILTTLVCGLAAQYFWTEPSGSWAAAHPSEVVGVVLFVAAGALISGLTEAWRSAHAERERSADALRGLQAVTDTALANVDSDRLIGESLARVRAVLNCDAATMLLVDPTGTYLTAVASDGLEDAVDPGVRIPVGQGFAGRIAESRAAAIVEDLATIDIISPVVRDRLRSLVGVPLEAGDRLVGVLHAGAFTRRKFTGADAHLLSLAADRIAVAIERARLHESERTARREAEKANEHLRVALEAGGMGTWEYTIRTGAVKWSPGLEAIHGFAPGVFPGTFEAFRAEIHPDDRDRVLHVIGRAISERQDHHVEYRIIRADGGVRWVEGRGQLFLDGAQQPDRMVGVCSDITDRKQAQQTLADQVQLLRTIDDAIYEMSPDLRITRWNEAAERMYGYTGAEAIGRTAFDLLRSNESPEQRAACLARAGTGDIVRVEAELRRSDGAPVWADVTVIARRTRDQVVTGFVCVHRDITERKRADERFRLAVEAAPAAMILVNDRGTVVLTNALTDELLGYSRDEIVGQPVDRFVPQRFRHNHPEHLEGFFAAPGRRRMGAGRDLHALRKDGSEVPVEIGLSPIETADGLFVLAAVSDITERKAVEESRAQLLLREQEARVEIERASRLKDEFLAVLSHELRTPLNAVLGYAHLLSSGTLPPDRTRHAVAAIQRNAEAQARLVESLLDLSRIMAGKLELDLEQLDLSLVLDAATDVIRPDADAKGITLDVVVPSPAPTFAGDAARLQQVFGNLLANATKFTARGGRVGIRVVEQNGTVSVHVSDTGRGIRPEFLPYVFDRFRQADTRTGRSPAGLGLGLALVREMVHAHGGTVVAASGGEGHGSTFTVTLPTSAMPASQSVRADHAGVARTSLRHLDVLVVDDDGDVRDLLALLLGSRGAVVRTASSTTEALEAIVGENPDVLLADVGMPDEDGYALIRKVRVRERDQRAGRLPAIAVTAYATAKDREQAIAAGYDRHVAKPVDADALVSAIAAVLDPRTCEP